MQPSKCYPGCIVNEKIITLLQESAWFCALDRPLQAALLSAGRQLSLQPGQWVYGEGDDSTGIVIVLKGMLRIEATAGPRTVLIGVARPGDVLGQTRYRGGGPRIVTARANRASSVLMVGDAALERLGADFPALWKAINALIYSQLDTGVHTLAQMLALRPRARIAARLLLFADSGQAPLTQGDLAELCGLSRKAVGAHLKALEHAGVIARGYGFIRLCDIPSLNRLAR